MELATYTNIYNMLFLKPTREECIYQNVGLDTRYLNITLTQILPKLELATFLHLPLQSAYDSLHVDTNDSLIVNMHCITCILNIIL